MARLAEWSLIGRCALFVLFLAAQSAFARCDPTTDPDKTDIANARAAVAANCDCAGAADHGEYTRCSSHTLDANLANKSCKGAAQRCAARSTCGKPGFVTCCTTKSGVTKCKTKKDAAHCVAPRNGTACVSAATSCCDACGGSGCAATTTTAPPTSTTTLPPPGCRTGSDFPTCGGPCNAGDVCQAVRIVPNNAPPAEECQCLPASATCHVVSAFVCQAGPCPPGDACIVDFTTPETPVCGCGPLSPSGAFVGER